MRREAPLARSSEELLKVAASALGQGVARLEGFEERRPLPHLAPQVAHPLLQALHLRLRKPADFDAQAIGFGVWGWGFALRVSGLEEGL